MTKIKVTYGKSEDGYLVFDPQGNAISEYQGEAELVWQKRDNDNANSSMRQFRNCDAGDKVKYPWCEYRQVYITLQQPDYSTQDKMVGLAHKIFAEREPVGSEESQFDKNRFYTNQLHDCPFCGAKASEELFMYRVEPDQYQVRCSFCQASMKHDRADKVIGIWNHRGLIKNRG